MVVSTKIIYPVPDLIPISEIRQRQVEILEMLQHAPVTLTQRGRAAAVMVSPDQWNAIIEELEELLDSVDAIEALQEIDDDPDSVQSWQVVKAKLVEEGRLDA